ncbi:phage integrase N-terminal SAM-like domain-containing protein [Actinoplanes sp. NPDC049118]|uniref:phage integrase N-terminal SAM-like domain-containing protein n=1 Tax=Actinoplanes sp. NPDC049118 TaxID=3155769 RepID=UPI0033F70C76
MASTALNDPLTRSVTTVALLDLDRLTDGLAESTWGVLLRDWDSSLRAANHPETTRYNYLLAVAQLARFLVDSGGVRDPALIGRKHVESFQVWMIETRSPGTALKSTRRCSSSSGGWSRRARSRSRR